MELSLIPGNHIDLRSKGGWGRGERESEQEQAGYGEVTAAEQGKGFLMAFIPETHVVSAEGDFCCPCQRDTQFYC